MKFFVSLIMLITVLAMTACTPPESARINIPGTPNYNPNYPPTIVDNSVRLSYKGQDAIYHTDEYSIFDRQWEDPADALRDVREYVTLKKPGYQDLERKVLEAQPRHSLATIVEDDLVTLVLAIFFTQNSSFTFTEGNFRVSYADGTSSVDRGVRLNTAGDKTKLESMRRSYANAPLKVSRKQQMAGREYVSVYLLLPRKDLNKKVVSIEQVTN